MRAETLYEVLGVLPSASPEAIKAAYKLRCMAFHPDRHPNDDFSDAMMKKINFAYMVLSDPVQRAAYDTQLARQRMAQAVRPRHARPAEPKPTVMKMFFDPKVTRTPLDSALAAALTVLWLVILGIVFFML